MNLLQFCGHSFVGCFSRLTSCRISRPFVIFWRDTVTVILCSHHFSINQKFILFILMQIYSSLYSSSILQHIIHSWRFIIRHAVVFAYQGHFWREVSPTWNTRKIRNSKGFFFFSRNLQTLLPPCFLYSIIFVVSNLFSKILIFGNDRLCLLEISCHTQIESAYLAPL